MSAPTRPDHCECDKYIHEHTPCTREYETAEGGVISSPALCIPCLFVCWNDDEEF
jgi:hypothetical protein